METEKNRELWQIAKKRVGFRRHLLTYIVINSIFWILWLMDGKNEAGNNFPWPVWPMFGWGIGLLFSYRDAYVFPKSNAVEKEYEKLIKK